MYKVHLKQIIFVLTVYVQTFQNIQKNLEPNILEKGYSSVVTNT
jgi:hypothetical protein